MSYHAKTNAENMFALTALSNFSGYRTMSFGLKIKDFAIARFAQKPSTW
jgi:hypothetical protein